jgi:hypothetical protein
MASGERKMLRLLASYAGESEAHVVRRLVRADFEAARKDARSRPSSKRPKKA